MATMLELKNKIPVMTPHGYGDAIIVIDYGIDVNTVWIVRLSGGIVKHYYSEDIRIIANEMENKGKDLDLTKNFKKIEQP